MNPLEEFRDKYELIVEKTQENQIEHERNHQIEIICRNLPYHLNIDIKDLIEETLFESSSGDVNMVLNDMDVLIISEINHQLLKKQVTEADYQKYFIKGNIACSFFKKEEFQEYSKNGWEEEEVPQIREKIVNKLKETMELLYEKSKLGDRDSI